jgi:surfactin synthase thioesterase subunit
VKPSVEAAKQWLTGRTSSPPASLRLYCFPHGGGSAAEYVRWGRALRGIDLHVVQLPGRGARWREQPFTRMDALVAAIVAEVAFDGPYAFFGHSLGAVVAYEVACALRAADRALPRRLIVSGHPAVCLPRRQAPIHDLPDDGLIAEVERRHGGIPPEAREDPSLRTALIGPLRADYEIVETYVHRPRPPLPCAISALAGTEDAIDAADLDAWQGHATPPLRVRRFPGGHFYLREHSAPVLREIARTARA